MLQTNFQDRLAVLLAKRKQLRQLLSDRTRWYLLAEPASALKVEQVIAELIQETLPPYDPRTDLHGSQLADVVLALVGAYLDPALADNPSAVWRGFIAGHSAEAFPQHLRSRLEALVAPLDVTIGDMLAEVV
jgi:hypothetical protein